MTISVGIDRQDPGDLPDYDQHWCHQTACHYLSLWWPRPNSLYGITNPQLVILVALKVLRNMLVGQFGLLTNGYLHQDNMEKHCNIWVRSGMCACLFTWFCYHLIAKPGNKPGTPSWPDPYPDFEVICHACLWPSWLMTAGLKSNTSLVFWHLAKLVPISIWSQLELTHWGLDKMAPILQTTFSNAFSWMKIYELWLKFNTCLFLRV